jgi:hypothetical protein
VDHLARSFGTKDCAILQDTLTGVAFCDPEVEFPEVSNRMPPEMLKVFRLAQLTIQYLLHSQEMLTEAVQKLNLDNEMTHKVNNNLTSFKKRFNFFKY